MHEMGITQGILAAAFEAAEKVGATRINEVRISVGELTEVVEFALQFAFESLTPETIAEGATLVVNHVPARSKCNTCGIEYDHDRFQMTCTECGSMDVTLLQGRELQIDSIEADAEPHATHAAAHTEPHPPAPADAEPPLVEEGLIDFDPDTVEE